VQRLESGDSEHDRLREDDRVCSAASRNESHPARTHGPPARIFEDVSTFSTGLDKNSDSFGVINELQEIAEVSLLGALGQKIIKTKI